MRLIRLLRNVVLVAIVAVILVAAVLLINVVTHGSRQMTIAAVPRVAVDEAAAASRLATAIRFRTLADIADADHSADAFRALHAHIAASEKPFAFIIDLVRNWAQPECGGLPDARGRVWSLEGAAKSGAGGPTDVPQTRSCLNPHHLPVWTALGPDAQRVLNSLGRAAVDTSSDEGAELCTGVYERFLTACPFCNWEPIPAKRTIEQVDGDVGLVDEETLARLRGEIREANTTPSLGGKWAAKHYKDHAERFRALQDLSQTLTWWGPAYELEQGRKLSDREQAKAFYLTFGVDVYTAQALKRADAAALRQKILDWFELKQITIAA